MFKKERKWRDIESEPARRLGGRMRRSKQQLDLRENAIEAYLDVETMLLPKIIRDKQGSKKR